MIIVVVLCAANSSSEPLTKASLASAGLVVLGCPRQNFTDMQFAALRRHVEEGGALLVLMEEGGEKKSTTNINFLLEEFGISVNNGKINFDSQHLNYRYYEKDIMHTLLCRELLVTVMSFVKFEIYLHEYVMRI